MIILKTAYTKRQAFWYGWFFGFGHFLAGLYWIPNSLLVEGAERFLWLLPFAAMGIPAVLAIYIGLLSLVFHLISKRFQLSGNTQILTLVNLWVVFELARAYLFTGFPWNLLGYSLLFNTELVQIASLGGVYLASWVAVLFALFPLYMRTGNLRWFALFVLISSYSYGVYYIQNAAAETSGKSVKLLQPNHKQKLFSDSFDTHKRFEDGLALMAEGEVVDYYIWPEATAGYHLNRNPEAVQAISDALPKSGLAIVGADRSKGYDLSDYQAWNSMYVISKNGIEAVYDKQHLVPFGEYVPFSDILPLENITGARVDFSKGEGRKLLNTEYLHTIPLICYEIIFPSYASYEGEKPDFISNITNDSWFGNSSGPHQHLAMTRMRAIESGLPVVRSAKTGISAVVNAHGLVVTSLGINQTGVVDSDIPSKIINDTVFNQYKLMVILLILVSSSIIVIFFNKKGK